MLDIWVRWYTLKPKVLNLLSELPVRAGPSRFESAPGLTFLTVMRTIVNIRHSQGPIRVDIRLPLVVFYTSDIHL